MSAVRRRTANDLLCGAITAPLLEYAVVILVHGVTYHNLDHLTDQDCRISVQIARINEELPLLTTKTVLASKSTFEEVLVVHTETLEELELLLCTAHDVVDEYDLKLAERQVWEYHHVSLAGQSSELYITLTIKSRQIKPAIAPNIDVQVLVQYLESPLDEPRGPVIVAGRDNFTNSYSQIAFNTNEQVQMSPPQGPSDQPQWYHTFLFRSCNSNQTIGLYLFHQPFVKRNDRWMLGEKIGECGLQLEEQLLSSLREKEEGICFTGLPLISVQGPVYLRISIKLGCSPPLTPNNIPAEAIKWGSLDQIPQPIASSTHLDPGPHPQISGSHPGNQTSGAQGEQRAKTPQEPAVERKESTVLPDHSAILQLLQRHSTPLDISSSVPAIETVLQHTCDNSAEYMSKMLEQQANELNKYRDAVKKMGKDILLCRDHIISLKGENTELKGAVRALKEPVHDVSLINIPRDDLVKEVIRARAALREEIEINKDLSRTCSKLKHAAKLQEKESSKTSELRNAHTAQNQLLQKLQEKVKVTRVLEKTCRDQERVIERLEGMLKLEETSPERHVTFREPMLALPPARLQGPTTLAVAKLEPLDTEEESVTFDHVPPETALKMKVRALENHLKMSQESHQDEIVRLTSDKMDLQLKLAKLKR